jgi:hypothetical protein
MREIGDDCLGQRICEGDLISRDSIRGNPDEDKVEKIWKISQHSG